MEHIDAIIITKMVPRPKPEVAITAEHPKILTQGDPPLLTWASETFGGKLRPNGLLWPLLMHASVLLL